MAHLLIIDDDPLVLRALVRALAGHTCTTACNGADAMGKLIHCSTVEAMVPFDLVISDVDMPVMTGFELYRWLSDQYPSQSRKVVFYTGSDVPGLSSIGVPVIRKDIGLSQTVREISSHLASFIGCGVAPVRDVATA